MNRPDGEGEGEPEFICSGCPNRCGLSYLLVDGAIVTLRGGLCPKGTLLLLGDLIKKQLGDSIP